MFEMQNLRILNILILGRPRLDIKSNDPLFHQTGPLNFDTIVVNSDSGEKTSLHSYFNKHLLSVQQLNSILGSVSRQIGALPQVDNYSAPFQCSRCIQEQASGKNPGQEEEEKI